MDLDETLKMAKWPGTFNEEQKDEALARLAVELRKLNEVLREKYCERRRIERRRIKSWEG